MPWSENTWSSEMTTGEIFGGADMGVSTLAHSCGLAASALAQYTGVSFETQSLAEAA